MNKHNYHIKNISSLGDDRVTWQTLCSSVFSWHILSLSTCQSCSVHHTGTELGSAGSSIPGKPTPKLHHLWSWKQQSTETNSHNCHKAGWKIPQCPNNYFLWIDRASIEGSQRPNRNLQIINAHRLAQLAQPFKEIVKSRCDGWKRGDS